MGEGVIIHALPAWLAYIALALCIGLLACRLWVLPPGDPDQIVQRTGSLFCISIAVMTAASLTDLLVRTVDMSGRPLAESYALVPAVLFRSHYGRVWVLRMAALLAVSVALISAGRRRDSRGLSVFGLAAFVIVAVTESASGHAADAGDFSMAESMDLLHLLAACAWGGGLLVLSFSVLPGISPSAGGSAKVMAGVASRFSRMAGLAVAVAGLTAVYNARLYVGGYRGLIATPYGWIVVAKAVIFFILLQLGGFNRYINVPLLLRWAGGPSSGEGLIGRSALRLFERGGGAMAGDATARRFARSVRAEAVLIAAILLCAALLRHEVPARHHSHIGPAGEMQHHSSGADRQGHDHNVNK